MEGERIIIFDTTLRDGEQSPGFSMNIEEKLQLARQLAKLKVDVIEAGFPIASPGDFQAVKRIAQEIKGPIICALARVGKEDIDRAAEALRPAERARFHVFIATSPIHRKYKLDMSPEEVLEAAIKGVKYARQFSDDVEFSAEDSTRTEMDFLCQVVEEAIKAGAKTINIPDTVGYMIPEEFGQRIETIFNKVPNIDKVTLSIHCHNDLGLAVSNSLAAIQEGARQVECTINGIGERAGNASLEEIVMALKVRKDFLSHYTEIKTEEIYESSRLVCSLTGTFVQPNKAIVGANAFSHEAGIHQHGVLRESSTYEIMTPQSIGLPSNKLVLGKHSGRHAFKNRLEDMGYVLSEEQINAAFGKFKNLADKKKIVYDDDIKALVEDKLFQVPEIYSLESLEYRRTTTGDEIWPTATVAIKRGDKIVEEKASGDGPVDASYKAIDKITGFPGQLHKYSINAIGEGEDALGEAVIHVKFQDDKAVMGKATDTDIIIASVKAYLNALNKALISLEKRNG